MRGKGDFCSGFKFVGSLARDVHDVRACDDDDDLLRLQDCRLSCL